jgi:hypothetical protein
VDSISRSGLGGISNSRAARNLGKERMFAGQVFFSYARLQHNHGRGAEGLCFRFYFHEKCLWDGESCPDHAIPASEMRRCAMRASGY